MAVPPPPPANLIKDIELRTGRYVGIDFDEDEAVGKFHQQDQSPLFSLLPREIRELVWSFALAQYEDQNHPFAPREYYYRPGHTARLKTDTTLLRVCRRIFLEANHLPMLQAEHSFYYHRPAPEARNPQWMASLTAHNRENFGHLHLLVQMFAIEGLTAETGRLRRYFLTTPAQPADFQPKVFHVTLRHTDWWWWESEAPLRLEDRWVQAMLDSPDLRSTQTFKLELETLDYKMDQLKPILDRIRNMSSKEYETHIIDGKPAKTRFVLCPDEETYTWSGPTDIAGNVENPYKDKTGLKYNVITLTWQLRFPEHPRAFIPKMRREPRIMQDINHSQRGYWNHHSRSHRYVRPRDLPYADESAHRHTMRKWDRVHRRDDPKPTELAREFVKAEIVHKAVRSVTKEQADDVEQQRWLEFGRLMGELLPQKWENEKSLLKFID